MTKRRIKWFLMNAGYLAILWLAVFQDSTGAGRALVALTWFFGIMHFLGGCIDDVRAKAQKKGRTIPAWLSHGVGAATMLILVWNGWWLTAFAYLLMEFGEATIYSVPVDKNEEETN